MYSSKRGQSTAYLYGQLLGYIFLITAVAVLVMNFNPRAKRLDTELDWSFLALKSGLGSRKSGWYITGTIIISTYCWSVS